MDRKPRRPGLLERTAEALDLPADALAGLPRLELVGEMCIRDSPRARAVAQLPLTRNRGAMTGSRSLPR